MNPYTLTPSNTHTLSHSPVPTLLGDITIRFQELACIREQNTENRRGSVSIPHHSHQIRQTQEAKTLEISFMITEARVS